MHEVTLTSTHKWVEHKVSDVDIIQDPFDDSMMVLSKPEEENKPVVVYGCSVCGEPLSFESLESSCSRSSG